MTCVVAKISQWQNEPTSQLICDLGKQFPNYLHLGGYAFGTICMCVCMCVTLSVWKQGSTKGFYWILLHLCWGIEWDHVNNPLKFDLHPPRPSTKVTLMIYWLKIDGKPYNLETMLLTRVVYIVN